MRTLSRFRLHLSVPSESPCMEPSWGLFCWKYIYFSIRFLWFQLSTGVLRLSGRWMIDVSPCSCRPSSTLSLPSHSNQRSRNVTTSFLVSHLCLPWWFVIVTPLFDHFPLPFLPRIWHFDRSVKLCLAFLSVLSSWIRQSFQTFL